MRLASPITGCFATFFFVVGSGCAPRHAAEINQPTIPLSDVPTVQRSASFAGVTAAYRSGAYSEALAQVQALSRKPDLSPADRLFLERQEEIIRTKATTGKDATDRPKSPGASRTTALTPLASPTPRDLSDCGPRSLLFVCRELGVPASLPALTKAAGTRPGVGSNLAGLTRAANSVGLSAKGVQVDADALRRVKAPALAWVDGNHFVAVTRIEGDSATVHDPNENGKEGFARQNTGEVALDTLLRRSGGILLLLERGKDDRSAGDRSATKD
jgi:hypothetical protein